MLPPRDQLLHWIEVSDVLPSQKVRLNHLVTQANDLTVEALVALIDDICNPGPPHPQPSRRDVP